MNIQPKDINKIILAGYLFITTVGILLDIYVSELVARIYIFIYEVFVLGGLLIGQIYEAKNE